MRDTNITDKNRLTVSIGFLIVHVMALGDRTIYEQKLTIHHPKVAAANKTDKFDFPFDAPDGW